MAPPRFLRPDDASRLALTDAAAEVAAAVVRSVEPGAWSGVDDQDLVAAVEALDPLPDQGVPFDTVLAEVEATVLAHGVRPSDPTCVAHLHSPTLITAAATELAIGMTNQSMDSYDQAPAATLVEDRLVRRIAEVVGLPSTASGVMTAGGTASNLLGLVLARERAARRSGHDVAADGLPDAAASWRIVASEAAHFSVQRAAMLLGLGRRAVVAAPTGRDGSIDRDGFDRTVDDLCGAGLEVIAVVGTAGTTDLGAIDPLDHLARRSEELDAWFHVDAAVGGALVLSDRHAGRLAGIAAADSVTIDLHKLWWQPISASALLVADGSSFGLIRQHSEYLDRADDVEEGVLNLVGRSLDTSRRFDALKALVSLRTLGRRELGRMIDHVVDTTARAAAAIDADPRFELLAPSATVMVVFRWVGSGVYSPGELDRVNTSAQRHLFATGRAVIGRTVLGGAVALKFTVVNPEVVVSDLVWLLDQIDAAATESAAVRAD